MSILVVGVSHQTAPVAVLERLALDTDGAAKLVRAVSDAPHVSEATVLATCNRIEVYADVERFHGSVEAVTGLLCDRGGLRTEELLPHVYVHYDDAAVSHLFHVAAGLDSMVLGEGQILGQTREALALGQDGGHVGPALNSLFQQALRVGKRGHAETNIDRAAPSLVAAALDRAAPVVGPLAGRQVLVVGAGAMAALAVSTAARRGASVLVANRTVGAAERLAEDHGGRALRLDEVGQALQTCDVLVSCTGSSEVVLGVDRFAPRPADRPLVVIDLALPHDVDPAVGALPSVTLIGLARLASELRATEDEEQEEHGDVAAVRSIVAEEVAAFVSARRAAAVTPTVVALRGMATSVVETELARLESRLPDLTPAVRAEVLIALRRVADKLLHGPTVRVKELADDTAGVTYATALAQLFALDPEAVEAVTQAEAGR